MSIPLTYDLSHCTLIIGSFIVRNLPVDSGQIEFMHPEFTFMEGTTDGGFVLTTSKNKVGSVKITAYEGFSTGQIENLFALQVASFVPVPAGLPFTFNSPNPYLNVLGTVALKKLDDAKRATKSHPQHILDLHLHAAVVTRGF